MKKKNWKNSIPILQTIFVIVSLFIVLLYSFLITYKSSNLLHMAYALRVLAIIGIILYILSKIKNFKFNRYELLIFGLIFFSVVSTIFAIDKEMALMGTMNRREGLYSYLFYYFLALNTLNLKNSTCKKIVIWEIISVGLINVIYGLLQTEMISIPDVVIPASWHYAKGLNGNSMYYGALMTLCYPLMAGLFIKSEKKSGAIIYGLLTWLFTLGMLISGSMALIVSSICIFVFILVKQLIVIYNNANKDELFRLGKIFIVLIMFVLTNMYLNNNNEIYSGDLKVLARETTDVAKGQVNDNFGSRRIYVWKASLKKAKEYPLTGTGIDNFRLAFDPPLTDPKTGELFTKAHNDYIQKTISEGFISGLYYIVFIVFIFISKIKKNDKLFYPLLIAFACYSIQIFFGISVTRVAPYYFVIMGLLVSSEEIIETNKKKKKKK